MRTATSIARSAARSLSLPRVTSISTRAASRREPREQYRPSRQPPFFARDDNAPRRVGQRGYGTFSSPHPSKPPQAGQPLRRTHPHAIREGELTPGMQAAEYEERRRKLMASLPDGAVVVCMGGTVRLMSQQIFYKFRQSTDFYYLTGFNEPDATLVLESRPSTSRGYKYTLFVPPKDEHDALWVGECSGVQGAVADFGADQAFPNTALSTHLPSLLRSEHLFVAVPPLPSPSASSQPLQPPPPRRRSSLLKLFTSDSSSSASSSSSSGSSSSDPPHLLISAALASERAKPLEREVQRLRQIKSKAELAIMKRAADMSAAAHAHLMGFARPGMSEDRLAVEFQYLCSREGSEREAYVPVVASGANALIIHYTSNDNVLDDGDLVLVDAGCELHMYASDITRTFPANGKFTDPQRDLYTAVLNAQKECVRRCKVQDAVSMNELHRLSCGLLLEELRQIGFKLNVGDVERRLYPHFLSHHLGSDLHDCPTADRSATLVAGNVITIEPGVYVPFDSAFPKHFHGMGIRVEDEVAFTNDGPLVLSANAPKEIIDIEGLR